MKILHRLAGHRRALAFLVLAIAAVTAPAASAEPLPEPTDTVILTVDGRIANGNDEGLARFDRAMLEALGTRTVTTSNPFIQGVHEFEGPLLSDLLAKVGATGAILAARALDDYSVDIPIEDAGKFPVILATRMDGEVMSVRAKGPIWIIYPVDQNEQLRSEAYSVRSIWQLKQLTVK